GAIFLDALGFDGDHALTVLLRDLDLTVPVLILNRDFFLLLEPRELPLLPLLGLNFERLRFLARAERRDLSLLLGLGVGLLPIELQDGLLGFDVLLANRLA